MVGRDAELEAARAAWGLRGCVGVVVRGVAGVGKTRLAEELLGWVAGKGVRTGRATASVAAAGIPLGAIAHLIPPGVELSDPVRGFAQVARALAGRDGSRRWVWLLDDVHLLDAASAVLVRQLMDTGIVRVIVTVRTGEPLGDAADALQAEGSLARIDLQPFGLEQVGEALRGALGGAVTGRTVYQMTTMSGGNALYLRELVLGALAQGSLVWDGSIWQLAEDRALPASPKLAELIEARLASVTESGDVLALLALCEPVSLADAEAVAHAPGTLARLEASGLVQVRTDGHRTTVFLAHPLYGEVLRKRLPTLRRRTVLRDQIARVRAQGARRREDEARIAAWELAATGTADPGLLVDAARLARYVHDYAQVLALLEALPEHAHTTATRLMQGEAHYELGHWEQCEKVLGRVDARTEQDVLAVTAARCENLFYNAGLEQEALELNHAAHQKVSSEGAHRTLRHGEAALEIARGRPARGLALLDDMGDDITQAPDAMTWILAAALKPIGLEMVGRTKDAVAWAQNAYAQQRAFDEHGLFPHPALHLIELSWALASNGQLPKAREVGERAFAELTAARLPLPRNWMALYLGLIEWHAGHPATARHWFAESSALGRTTQRFTVRPALEGLAACAALLGDTDAAEHALAQARKIPQRTAFTDLTHLARAWLAVAHGDLPTARSILTDGATTARTAGLATIETVLLTDLARLGDPGQAALRLAELAGVCDGAFARARAGLAGALAAGDPDRLTAAAHTLATIGADLLAAEASAAAADADRTAGHARKAAAATQQAQACALRCEGAGTPLLVFATVTTAALTVRERDIALLAAHGTSSKDIADTLHLSVRTVDNHLLHAYTKLGVTSRRELAQTLT
jgi:DNA-binding CsgD family transcriptional regulator